MVAVTNDKLCLLYHGWFAIILAPSHCPIHGAQLQPAQRVPAVRIIAQIELVQCMGLCFSLKPGLRWRGVASMVTARPAAACCAAI